LKRTAATEFAARKQVVQYGGLFIDLAEKILICSHNCETDSKIVVLMEAMSEVDENENNNQ
jgi:hypothetical protein